MTYCLRSRQSKRYSRHQRYVHGGKRPLRQEGGRRARRERMRGRNWREPAQVSFFFFCQIFFPFCLWMYVELESQAIFALFHSTPRASNPWSVHLSQQSSYYFYIHFLFHLLTLWLTRPRCITPPSIQKHQSSEWPLVVVFPLVDTTFTIHRSNTIPQQC